MAITDYKFYFCRYLFKVCKCKHNLWTACTWHGVISLLSTSLFLSFSLFMAKASMTMKGQTWFPLFTRTSLMPWKSLYIKRL